MKISTDYRDEFLFPNKPSGGYEWWYFDTVSSDKKWSLVIIFYLGNPFSPEYIRGISKSDIKPENFPAVSVSLYKNNSTEFYSFLEYDIKEFSWESGSNTFRIGSNSFQREEKSKEWLYNIKIDQILHSKHSLKANLTFKSSKNELNLKSKNGKSLSHNWNLLQPIASVTGKFEVNGKNQSDQFKFEGTGYHDHNIGSEPMKDDFDDWYWGRLHFKNYTLIYYLMNRRDQTQHEAWLINQKTNEIEDVFDSIEQDSFLINKLGLRSSRKLYLKGKECELTIQSYACLDDGPFYQRFAANAIINMDNQIESANGITEYIKPSRIYSKVFWPLVHMRLRYKYKNPHWVQKSKKMYEWTW